MIIVNGKITLGKKDDKHYNASKRQEIDFAGNGKITKAWDEKNVAISSSCSQRIANLNFEYQMACVWD